MELEGKEDYQSIQVEVVPAKEKTCLQKLNERRARLSHFMHTNHKFHMAITALVILDISVITAQVMILKPKVFCFLISDLA